MNNLTRDIIILQLYVKYMLLGESLKQILKFAINNKK